MDPENQTELVSNAVESITRGEIDMQISTAKRYPRTLSKVKADMLSFATLDEDTASACFYTLPRGGKTIQGPSVRLAEIAVSCYGNLRAGSRILQAVTTGDAPHVVVQAVAHDLEKNTAITIEKRRRITSKKDHKTGGRKPIDEDDVNLAANACSAIAFRDAVWKIIPQALIKPVFEAAKQVAIGDAKSFTKKRGQVIDRLKQMGVTEPRILETIGCAKVEDIQLPQLEILIGYGTAIKDGEVTIEEAFPGKNATAPKTAAEIKLGAKEEPAKESEPKQEPATMEQTADATQPERKELAEWLAVAGFNSTQLFRWCVESGFHPTADSCATLDELPNEVCGRLMKAKAGLLKGLTAMFPKEGGAQ